MSHRSTSYDLYKSPRRSRAYSSAFDDTPSILRSSYRGGQSPGRRVEIKEPRSFYRDHEASMTAPDLYGKYYDDSSSKLKLDVLELENKLKQRDLKLAELERQLGDYQDIENHQAKTVRQLQERIETLQRDYTANATAASRGEITISSLQNDNRLLQDRLQEVETRLRRQMEERDEMSSTATEYERNYEDLKRIINATIITDGYGIESSRSHDSVRRKVTEFANQFQEMKLRNQQLQSSLDLAEDEAKKNQDTVKKLLDDIERTRKYISGTDIIKDERDAAIRNQDRLQEELKKMEERMERSREAWESAQHELRQHQMKVGELDSTLRQKDLHTQAANTEFRAFKETLATLLSENYSLLPPTEDAIKERIRHLMMNKQDINRVTNQLDDKVKELSSQLEEQAKLHKNAVGRARKAEETVDRLHHQLKGAEGELTATDILKEGLQGEKFKYQRFLEQMAEVMKLESVAKDLGVALNGESLLARAEQLVRFEEEMVGKRNTQLNNTHRQLKDAKRELETKDTHLDLLRKKLLTLESDASVKAERDWEEVVEDNRKLARQVEKLSKQLHDNKQTVHAMKSESAENKSLKMTVEEQRRLLRDMERKLKEFDDLRERQARKIATLHSVKNQTEADASHGLKVTESTIQSLSNELQRLKLRTEELQKREKQLVDLRTVIARMLGLDISTLAVPDYEIISRLEKIIEGAHESVLEWNKMPAGRQANGVRAGNVDASNHYKRAYVMGAESQRRRDTSRTRPATSAGGRWK